LAVEKKIDGESVLENKNMDIVDRYPSDDEIDLFELFSSLCQQWRWWAGITVLGVVVSIIIALSTPKQYEVSAQVSLSDQLSATIFTNNGYVEQTRDELFLQYYQRLMSPANFSRYVEQGGWLVKLFPDDVDQGRDRVLLEKLRQSLQIEVSRPKPVKGQMAKNPEVVTLSLLGKDESVTADFINGYIQFSEKDLITSLMKSGQRQKELEVNKINTDIRLLRLNHQKKLTARLQVLNEALVLAEKIGVKKPNEMNREPQTLSQGFVVNALGSGSDLFLKGSEYLKQEIINIQSRESQDTFIEELFPLFARLESLDSMSFDFTGARLYKLEMEAVVDGQAEKPKRALIVAIGTVLSFFVGLLVALVAGTMKRRKEVAAV
jgi:LPS O-antigen subunit length determinant protein (WzzB/FepE family)